MPKKRESISPGSERLTKMPYLSVRHRILEANARSYEAFEARIRFPCPLPKAVASTESVSDSRTSVVPQPITNPEILGISGAGFSGLGE